MIVHYPATMMPNSDKKMGHIRGIQESIQCSYINRVCSGYIRSLNDRTYVKLINEEQLSLGYAYRPKNQEGVVENAYGNSQYSFIEAILNI